MRNKGDINQLLNGGPSSRSAPNPPTMPMEGTIHEVMATTATFIIPEYSGAQLYGPARFTRTTEPPQPGDKCLVVFVGSGIDRAWIVAWNLES